MPHQDYDALRRELEREHDPLTFTLFGELFTTVAAPRLGDSFDLIQAPEFEPGTEEAAVFAVCAFIKKMLTVEDRHRWDQALYRLGPEHGPLIIAIGIDLAEQFANRPTAPPSESSDGRPGIGERPSAPSDETAGAPGSTP